MLIGLLQYKRKKKLKEIQDDISHLEMMLPLSHLANFLKERKGVNLAPAYVSTSQGIVDILKISSEIERLRKL